MSATLAASAPLASTMNPRTRLLLHGKVAPTLLRLAWPNTLVMLAQASVEALEPDQFARNRFGDSVAG
jgi:hypothetical protein